MKVMIKWKHKNKCINEGEMVFGHYEDKMETGTMKIMCFSYKEI